MQQERQPPPRMEAANPNSMMQQERQPMEARNPNGMMQQERQPMEARNPNSMMQQERQPPQPMEDPNLVNERDSAVKPKRQWAGLRLCLSISLFLLVSLGITILVMALTVFKARDPTTTLTSFRLSGVTHDSDLFRPRFLVNVSLSLVVTVENPNFASFRHFPGTVDVSYRERKVGEGVVAEGKVPARGKEDMGLNVTMWITNFTAYLRETMPDLLKGKMEFNTLSRVPGRVNFLGIIKKDVVMISDCLTAFTFPDLVVLHRHCNDSTSV